MSRVQKILTTALWGLAVLMMIAFVAIWQGGRMGGDGAAARDARVVVEPPADIQFPVPAFDLVDQESQPATLEQYKGKVWVADFVFTRCGGPCPRMTAAMAKLRQDLPTDVQLVTFTVDPAYDTPAVLKEYAAKHEADADRWRFLTGDKAGIYQVAEGMKLAVIEGDIENEFIHSEKFVLVDQAGNVRNYYHGLDPESVATLAKDAAELVKGRP